MSVPKEYGTNGFARVSNLWYPCLYPMTQSVPTLPNVGPQPMSPIGYFLKGCLGMLIFCRPVFVPAKSDPDRSTQRDVMTSSDLASYSPDSS